MICKQNFPAFIKTKSVPSLNINNWETFGLSAKLPFPYSEAIFPRPSTTLGKRRQFKTANQNPLKQSDRAARQQHNKNVV